MTTMKNQATRQISILELLLSVLGGIIINGPMYVISIALGIITMFYFGLNPGSEMQFATFLQGFGYTSLKFNPVFGIPIFFITLGGVLRMSAAIIQNAMEFITAKKTVPVPID